MNRLRRWLAEGRLLRAQRRSIRDAEAREATDFDRWERELKFAERHRDGWPEDAQ